MGLDEGEHASTAVRGFDHGEKLDVHLRRFVGEEGSVNLSKAISRDHLRLHLYYGYLELISGKAHEAEYRRYGVLEASLLSLPSI
jgi:hypothetical protein